MSNERYGRLVVKELHHIDRFYKKHYVCVCDCGNEIVTRYDRLQVGKTSSCGCIQEERSERRVFRELDKAVAVALRAAEREKKRAEKEKQHAAARARRVELREFCAYHAYTKSSYDAMVARCKTVTAAYPSYGQKVEVCARWLDGENGKTGFECFVEDMGPRPRGLSIDRQDGAKGYEPGNCAWATPLEQANNTKRRVLTRKELLKKITSGL